MKEDAFPGQTAAKATTPHSADIQAARLAPIR